MNRREYEGKLREWEDEGYDVSELREKWFDLTSTKDDEAEKSSLENNND